MDQDIEQTWVFETGDWEQDPLGTLLVERGKIETSELKQLFLHDKLRASSLSAVLMKSGLVSELDIADAIAHLTGLHLLSEDEYPEHSLTYAQLSPRFLNTICAVPIGECEQGVIVVMAEPRDSNAIHAMSVAFNKKVEVRLGLYSDIQRVTNHYFESGEVSEKSADISSDQNNNISVEQLRDLVSEAPVIRMVNHLIQNAVEQRASDIHAEPTPKGLRIRYRVDSVLHDVETFSVNHQTAVCSRIKLMARLDIAERRLPQDGRLQMKVAGKNIDMRVATSPGLHGESIVIRIFDKSSIALNFEKLGFDEDLLKRFLPILKKPHGIVLVTGPTGSGKTTSLYAGLALLNSNTKKIITVEDPIEYQLEGINQIQVQTSIGLDFSTILRSILRQDPDVIMVGEMRDSETAKIATQAALTGHMVLSTLHTNSAAAAFTRLIDMGIDEYLLTSTINGVLAQRLVRCLCDKCKEIYYLSPVVQKSLNIKLKQQDESVAMFRAVGCDGCSGTGYKGRVALLEFIQMSSEIERLILKRASAHEIEKAAISADMKTMLQHGIELACKGITSLDEVYRVTQELN